MGAGFVGRGRLRVGRLLSLCLHQYRPAGERILAEITRVKKTVSLRDRRLEAVAEAFATATPSGKRNSYGHHARASYIRAEAGETQPRSLAAAFLRPVEGVDLMRASIEALEAMATKFDDAYGPQADAQETMDVDRGVGNLGAIKAFVAKQIQDA